MGLFVADASAVLASVSPGEDAQIILRFERLVKDGEQLAVPALWHLELANVPLIKLRRKMMTAAQAQEAFEILQSYPIKTDAYSAEPSVVRHVWRLVLKHALTSYDAAYLELAIRLGCPLLTSDAALLRAASSEGVPLV